MSNDLIDLDLAGHVIDPEGQGIGTIFSLPSNNNNNNNNQQTPSKLSKLRKFAISMIPVGAQDIANIVRVAPHLESLTMINNEQFDDDAVAALIGLDIDDPNPTRSLPTPLPNLKELNLPGCEITDNGCVLLSKSVLMDQLEHFNINFNYKITTFGFNSIIFNASLSSLKTLRVKLTDQQIPYLFPVQLENVDVQGNF